MGRTRRDELIPILEKAYWLSSPKFAKREAILHALATIGSVAATEAILRLLQEYFRRDVLASEKAIKSLNWDRHSRDPEVMATALVSIGNIAVPKISELLQTPNADPGLRKSTAEILGRIGTDPAIRALLLALGDQDLEALLFLQKNL